jgi:SAM-dependent methyltransferase
MYKEFLAHLKGLEPGRRFLEIGAGTGLLTKRMALAFPNANITALDISPSMVAYGRQYIAKAGVGDRVNWIVGDAANGDLIAPLGKFDLIYGGLVLHEFEKADKIIRLLCGSIRENGIMAFLDLRRVWWLYWIPSNEGFISSIRKSYKPFELAGILRELGFKKWEIRSLFPFLLMAIIRLNSSAEER